MGYLYEWQLFATMLNGKPYSAQGQNVTLIPE